MSKSLTSQELEDLLNFIGCGRLDADVSQNLAGLT